MFVIQGVVVPDSLRPLLDSVFRAPEYRWVTRPNLFGPLIEQWQRFMNWLSGLSTAAPALYWLLIIGLVVLLVVIVVHASWVMVQTLKAAGAPGGNDPAAAPAEVRGARWYRRQAERLAAEGRFAQAMQADFVGLVLELDQRGQLRFHPSKTPYEYIAELRGNETARSEFGGMVQSLYGYAFAGLACGPGEFAEWHSLSLSERYAASH